MRLKTHVFLFTLCIGLFYCSAQSVAQDVLDGVYKKVTQQEKQIIPYDHIREADVFWSKRIWREIDVREKRNLPFKYPKEPLIEIIHTAAKNGELTVYDPTVIDADQFIEALSLTYVQELGKRQDTTFSINPITLEEEVIISSTELTWDKIVKFRVKEDWFFDEETSTFQVRIIGLAPIKEAFDASGNMIGIETMYWVYYPDLRPILARYEIYNAQNDAVRLSWEDAFEARLFASYVYKESNVHDRLIQDYSSGVDALLESDRIQNDDLFLFEHDLWTY